MKRILVFSDTHGSITAARSILAESRNIECILHLGDHARDAAELQAATNLRVIGVRGNCDYDSSVPEKQLVTIDGVRILLVHGHRQHAGSSLLHLSLAAQEAEASVVCFGHTHKSLCLYENGLLLLNPGSISQPRDGVRSYAILEISNGFADAQIFSYDNFSHLQK